MPRGPAGPLFLSLAIVLLDLDLSRQVVVGARCQLQAMNEGGAEVRRLTYCSV